MPDLQSWSRKFVVNQAYAIIPRGKVTKGHVNLTIYWFRLYCAEVKVSLTTESTFFTIFQHVLTFMCDEL